MSNKIIYSGQSFLDKVIELTGSIENAFEMALLNKIMITDDVKIGNELQQSKITNRAIVDYFNSNNRPATSISPNQPTEDYSFPGEFPFSF